MNGRIVQTERGSSFHISDSVAQNSIVTFEWYLLSKFIET